MRFFYKESKKQAKYRHFEAFFLIWVLKPPSACAIMLRIIYQNLKC